MKTINVTFTENEYEDLNRIKGNRTWHDSIIEEFGIGEATSPE
jgi:predicted CopG family antitoxin